MPTLHAPFAASLLAISGIASGFACSTPAQGSQRPGAQSLERQSDAEYDVAEDYWKRGELRAALDHSRHAVELNPDNGKANYLTSFLYLAFCSGDDGFESVDCQIANAEKSARAAISTDDRNRNAKNLLGQILIDEKKYAEAIDVLEPLTRDPGYSSSFLAWGNLGWAQVLGGDVDKGIASLKNAVTQPSFCVGLYHLGLAYDKKGDEKSAEGTLTDAVSVQEPACQNLQDAWEARARVRTKLGDTAGARSDFERCRDISARSKTGRVCVAALGGASSSPTPP